MAQHFSGVRPEQNACLEGGEITEDIHTTEEAFHLSREFRQSVQQSAL